MLWEEPQAGDPGQGMGLLLHLLGGPGLPVPVCAVSYTGLRFLRCVQRDTSPKLLYQGEKNESALCVCVCVCVYVCICIFTHGLPKWLRGKESACQCRSRRRSLGQEEMQPTPVFLPGKSHGQRSLAGYSPWGVTKESNMT